MAGTQFSLLRGRVLRVTKTDGCGNRVLGPTNQVTSSGWTTVALAAQTDAGTAIAVTNAAGVACITDTPAPRFTGYQVTLTFCQVDPDLFSLLTGQPVVNLADGTTRSGFEVNTGIDLSQSGFALELWSNVPSNACVGGVQQYGYSLLPFLQGGTIGDITYQNDAITFTVNNALTKDGNNWGVGLYNVVKNVGGVDSPLNVAVPTTNHLHMEMTATVPPTASGPGQVGVPATSAVAGIPGTYLPVNSYGRANLAAMTGLTASPATNWTAGQYVTMLDGNKTNWNGTSWVAGAHP